MRFAAGIAAVAAALVMAAAPMEKAYGAEGWRAEFEAACSRTSEAMTLSVAELTALIERCDRIRTAVQAEDETVAKVYLKRLEKCRNLYVYVLDFKKNGSAAP